MIHAGEYARETIGTALATNRFVVRSKCSMTDERIVAVGLLTKADLARLGEQFSRVWPVEETPCFGALLDAIDQADRELQRKSDDSCRSPSRQLGKS